MDSTRRDLRAVVAAAVSAGALGTAASPPRPASAQATASGRAAVGAGRPRMATDIPPSIVTPNRVETRIGTLEFFDGVPLPDTVRRA
jgi:hypothetical protein